VPWKPSEPGEVPTLGWYVLDWIEEMLAAPDRPEYEPFIPTREQADFILRFYEIDWRTGKRVIRRGVLSRSRGWGKSPFLSSIALVEALGDVVPAGWDAAGQPVGKPWSSVRTPLVQVAAVSEAQTKNSWAPLLEMLDGAPALDAYPGLEPLGTFVNLPRGRIEPITSSPSSVKGNKAHFAILDQTEEWKPGNGGLRLYDTMKANAAKIGGSFIETPNAYTPGDQSVAERTADAWRAMEEGRAKLDRGILYDHREAPGKTDMVERESLVAGLRYAYGDSSDHPDGCVLHEPPCAPGWSPLENLIATIWDPDTSAQQARADFLNQITHATNSWISEPEWNACRDDDAVLADRDIITLGFDGSRGRVRGKPDATALVGCRVSDGYLFEVGVWEADDDPKKWDTWEPSIAEIEGAITGCFARYTVVGFYCDPAKDWRSHVNAWEAKFGARTKVKATPAHPFEWWMTGGRSGLVQRAIEQLEGSIRNRDVSHSGSFALTRHVLNARRRITHTKLALAKESDYSSKKIDAAVAAVLAFQARLDAVAAGHGKRRAAVIPSRIR
jgi:phage terminase large subunit-like protein